MPRRAGDRRRLLLIGWDGADFNLVRELMGEGCLPHLAALAKRGVRGSLTALDPSECTMGWTSMVTGVRAFAHGIFGSLETADEDSPPRLARSTSRSAPALWNYAHQHGLRSVVVGWPATFPAEAVDGAIVSNVYAQPVAGVSEPWPLASGAVYPPDLATALSALRVHPGELDRESLVAFIPDAAHIDQRQDPRVAVCARVLAEAVSVHGAATWLMAHETWNLFAVQFSALNEWCKTFAPFHPPRPDNVPIRDFELYRHVVKQGYMFLDQLLGRLLDLAGDDTNVVLVSEHGFKLGETRPRFAIHTGLEAIEQWRESRGVVFAAGDGIAAGSVVHGMQVLDVAPSLLGMLGIRAPAALPGRMRAELTSGSSHTLVETTPGASNDRRGDATVDTIVDDHGAPAGYLVLDPGESFGAVAEVNAMNTYLRARSFLGADQIKDALAPLELLVLRQPAFMPYRFYLAQSYYALGRLRACEDQLDAVLERDPQLPWARMLKGLVCIANGDSVVGIARLQRLGEAPQMHHVVALEAGRALLALKAWNEARQVFVALQVSNPDAVGAHCGLCAVAAGLAQWQCALEHARAAVAVDPMSAEGHWRLGEVLANLDDPAAAVRSLRFALECDPELAPAHALLADLLERHPNEQAQAAFHRGVARALRAPKR